MLKKILVPLAFILIAGFSIQAQQLVSLNPQTNNFVALKAPFNQFAGGPLAYAYKFPVQPQNALTIALTDSVTSGTDTVNIGVVCTANANDPGTLTTIAASWINVPFVSVANSIVPTTLVPSNVVTISFAGTTPTVIVQTVPTTATQCAIELANSAGTTDILTISVTMSAVTPFIATASLDPCTNQKRSIAVVNIATATTTQIIPAGGAITYICGWNLFASGASQNFAFVAGGAATCTGSPQLITGTFGTGTLVALDNVQPIGATIAQGTSSSGQNVCITTTGATVSLSGNVIYVYR